MNEDDLIRIVTEFYLDSGDFNGYPGHILRKQYGLKDKDILNLFHNLVSDGRGSLVFGDLQSNPHIRAFSEEPKENQLSKLPKADLTHICLYPSKSHLRKVVDQSKYNDRPYTLELALGAGNYDFRSFDLSVLEIYRNDPRYYYTNDDIDGKIVISDEYYGSKEVPYKDKIALKTFGFAYDNDRNRAVASFCIYLNRLTPEHQGLWKLKELKGSYELHPEYFRNSILGQWRERLPIMEAFCIEIYLINQMSKAMNRENLFRKDFGEYGEDKPKEFTFLVRPTLKEFNDFISLLDKLLSDNINISFFQNEVPFESDIKRDDGKTIVLRKGSLQILDDWIHSCYITDDWSHWEESIKSLKDIRQMRNKPAHAIDDNKYDQEYFKEQRKLIIRAYKAVRTIRMIFENHPDVEKAGIEVDEFIRNGKIWFR